MSLSSLINISSVIGIGVKELCLCVPGGVLICESLIKGKFQLSFFLYFFFHYFLYPTHNFFCIADHLCFILPMTWVFFLSSYL